jgi:putative protease
MLKITAPFRKKKEVIPLIEAGADELYCGYLPAQWQRKYTGLEFERKGLNAYLTLNGLYVGQQYSLLLKIIKDLKQVDFDGYIIADVGLLLTLRDNGFKKQIHISTGGTAFNREAVGFYRDLGASRIVLDRQVTLESMRQLSAASPDIEFEVFILHTLCVYIDGFCTFLHLSNVKPFAGNKGNTQRVRRNIPFGMMSTYDLSSQGDACTLQYSVRARRIEGRQKCARQIQPVFYKSLTDGLECGACALYDIAKTNITSVKIVGRQGSVEVRLKSVKFIRQSLGFLRENKEIAKKDFLAKVQGIYRSQGTDPKKECRGNNCYHPEVLL